jgi:putative tricarboxylic transport membrane protein
MTTAEEPQEHTVTKTVDKAQYLVCAVLVAVGAFLIYDALTLEAGFARVDPVGPKLFPVVIGVILILLAIILAIAIPRGSVGEADAGEDVDPNMPGDWRTVGLLVGLFVGLILLVNPLGWVITSALFFAGAATILGSRHTDEPALCGDRRAVGYRGRCAAGHRPGHDRGPAASGDL